ncbi:MAG: sulfotransferase [Thermodesulfobacteriota bacterium]
MNPVKRPMEGQGCLQCPDPYIFVVGCARSGTTILAEVLGRHPEVAQWYEPYFVWDYCLGNAESDSRTGEDITRMVKDFIRKEFELFRKKTGAKIVVEKSPENSFRLPFVHAIFPHAKWIHIYRDGRDVTLSIHREWEKRRKIVEQQRWRDWFSVAWEALSLQPYWRNRLQAIWFEVNNGISTGLRGFLNKSKWNGKVGWGPRFPGWAGALEGNSVLRFNALQWVRSVEAIQAASCTISRDNFMEVRYEAFITDPERVLSEIFLFAGLSPEFRLAEDLNAQNTSKWVSAFTSQQIEEIAPILTPMLRSLGYVRDANWWFESQPEAGPAE